MAAPRGYDLRDQLEHGMTVVDSDGMAIGTIGEIYPHYLAVADHEGGWRVPFGALESVEARTVRISVPKSALDPLTDIEPI